MDTIQIKSIAQLHSALNLPEPDHPLISIINTTDFIVEDELLNIKVFVDLYFIALKNKHCGLDYGRQQYDFDKGTLLFTAPNQMLTATKPLKNEEEDGWLLFFHPDLIRETYLAKQIASYNFFEYNVSEALHLSENEKSTLNECVNNIRMEYQQKIDKHSHRVIVSSIELLLNYSLRYYERQFSTRKIQHKGVVCKFEQLIKTYFETDLFQDRGIPNIQYFADKLNLSPNYLSDLLQNETGSSTKSHINIFIVEKAKDFLLGSENSISEIGFSLGFNYPHYFTRFFKANTGQAPSKFRNLRGSKCIGIKN